MSVNRERPHILFLPEDQANREIVNGYITHSAHIDHRRVFVTKSLGGWKRVCDVFEYEYVPRLRANTNCHVVMLIDFDEKTDRRDHVARVIPDDVRNRAFVIGVWSQPEMLKRAKGLSFEELGREIAADCSRLATGIWSHELLKHNGAELDRMWETLAFTLFPNKPGQN